jgi:hypothetical protein
MKRLVIGFFLIQVLIDLAHSVTLFPFVHYAMFSESFARPDSLPVYEIIVDGRRLQQTDFSIYQWDMVQNPLLSLQQQTRTGDFAFDKEKMGAGMQKAGLGGLYKTLRPNLDNAPNVTSRFPQWYRNYLGSIVGHPIRTLQVDLAWYHYSEGRWRLLKKENRINIPH